MDFDIFTWSAIASLITLTVMEVVLGIDNIIFISIVAGKLPPEQQKKARVIGISLALIMRVGLLFAITWIMQSTKPLFGVFGFEFSIRDLILLAGGLFLVAKSTTEIHGKLEGAEHERKIKPLTLNAAIFQIVLLDMVFSFDSILTAIGIAKEVLIMIIAVIISMVFMLIFAKTVSDFVNKHPTVKMLALAFLIMIGVMLVAEGFHQEIEKGYLYFGMAFAFAIEMLNMRVRKKSQPVKLHSPYDMVEDEEVQDKI